MREKKRRAVCVLAVLCLVLGGCKESDVIQNLVYTDDAGEIDDMEAVMRSEDGEKTDKWASTANEEEAQNTDPNEQEQIASEAEASNAEITASEQSGDAQQTTGTSNARGEGDSTSDNFTNESDGSESSGEGDGTGEQGTGESGTGDPNDNTTDPLPENNGSGSEGGRLADDPNARQVYDSDGDLITLPEHVNRVAAAGTAAVAVQMLGGADEEGVSILCASSESFTGQELAQQVFEDEGISEIATLWEDDGSKPMSEENFAKLLEMHPDCCIAVSGEANFSTDQIQRLKEADIPYVLLPFDMAYQIEESVQTLGEVLGDRQVGDTTSEKLAAKYVKYVKNLEADIESKHGYYSEISWDYYREYDSGKKPSRNTAASGIITNFIEGWEEDAFIRIVADGTVAVEQSGLAYCIAGWETSPVSYYMALAGVSNRSANTPSRFSEWENLQWPLWPIFYYSSDYFAPYSVTCNMGRLKNSRYDADSFGEFLIMPYMANQETADAIAATGTNPITTCDAVIVSDHNIKENLLSSMNSQTGLYRPGFFSESGKEQAAMCYVNGVLKKNVGAQLCGAITYGFVLYEKKLEGGGFTDLKTRIWSDFDIYVNPDGIGSWSEGSVESVLEGVWVSNQFYEGYSEKELKEEVKSFYSSFYRCGLSGAQVDQILDGK